MEVFWEKILSHQEFIDIRKKLQHIIDAIDDGCVMDYVRTKLKEI